MYGIKKHRGLTRYYKNLSVQERNLSAINFTDPELAWFDRWHLHFDNWGYGNNSFHRRKPHLDKLFRHFELLEQKASLLSSQYQIWATILDYDSQSDALYLHTPNPNKANFPLKIKALAEQSTLMNKDLENYLSNLNGYQRLYGQGDEAFCIVYKTGVGLNCWI